MNNVDNLFVAVKTFNPHNLLPRDRICPNHTSYKTADLILKKIKEKITFYSSAQIKPNRQSKQNRENVEVTADNSS